MTKSKIEWTDRVWNPVTGCTKVSQGCKNCYAETMANRFWKGRKFTDVQCHQDRLTQPLSWKKPSMVFVNSMSDLFHEDVPFLFISSVFSVMADMDMHTFQVLTKRPDRIIEFIHWKKNNLQIDWAPSSNVWLGVSIENDRNYDRLNSLGRIKLITGVTTFVSYEPALGLVNMYDWFNYETRNGARISLIDWFIAGGESGANARPPHPDWFRIMRDQCIRYGVPFFFKQWGAWAVDQHVSFNGPFNHGFIYHTKPKEFRCITIDGYSEKYFDILDGSNEAMKPQKITKETPNAWWMAKVGKKAAGRLLDGIEWNELPEVKR